MQKQSRNSLKKLELKHFNIGKSLDYAQRATIIFQGPENVLYDIFMNPETKSIVKLQDNLCGDKNHLLDFLKKNLL